MTKATGIYVEELDAVIIDQEDRSVTLDYFDLDRLYWNARNAHLLKTREIGSVVTDADILDAIRTGCRTAPDVVRRLYGLDGTGSIEDRKEYRAKRSQIYRNLNSLAKHGLIRRTGLERIENSQTTIFEAVE